MHLKCRGVRSLDFLPVAIQEEGSPSAYHFVRLGDSLVNLVWDTVFSSEYCIRESVDSSQTKGHGHWSGSKTSTNKIVSGQYTWLARSFPPVALGKAYEHHVGKALHLAAYCQLR